jgi:cytochrome c556
VPAIWTDKDKFASQIDNLKTLEDAQAALIQTGAPDDVGKAGQKMGGQGCGGCHSQFREKLPG